MATTDQLLNTLFDRRYRIMRKLGSGGMANVYLAEDQELGRRVAIKILNERHAGDDQFVERFRREAKNAAGLSHPNIVSIYDRGEAEGTYYISMEYLEGRSLKELILARGPAPISVAIDYARQILGRHRPLRAAHRDGAVQRRDPCRARDEAPLEGPGAALAPAARDPARPRLRRHARSGEVARGALRERRRDGRRPRPHLPRRRRQPGDRGGRHGDPCAADHGGD